MLRLPLGVLTLMTVLAIGCGDAATDATGGTGGVPIVEPGPTCTDFCLHTVGDCAAFPFTEASCRQGCQTNLNDEYEHAQACGEAAEAVFQCVTDLDCQGVYDWRDRNPADGYPCRDAVLAVDGLIADGICLPAG